MEGGEERKGEGGKRGGGRGREGGREAVMEDNDERMGMCLEVPQN